MATMAAVRAGGTRDVLRHLLCILALMWAPLVNGAPFLFPDTTSYVRAADVVAYKLSHGRTHTVWTKRYEKDLAEGDALRAQAPGATQAPAKSRLAGNDVRAGNIMSGRSPYIGVLLWLSYVVSDFWLFVVLQAAVCYALLLLALRHFGLDRPRIVAGTVAVLAIGTALPYFNGLMLADALAAFGIVAFLLLATDRGRLSRGEGLFVWGVLAMSLVSHLTHIVMLLGMLGIAALLVWRGLLPWPGRGRLLGLAGLLVVAFGSIALTSFVVEHAFQKKPQLVPLMTARFIADGPGARFVRERCGDHAFAVCDIHLPPDPVDAQHFLWDTQGPAAAFLIASPEQRARMSGEDTAFAIAVLKAYPFTQSGMLLKNTLLQLAFFPAGGYNQVCMADAACFPALPEAVRQRLQASLGGRQLWPITFMTGLFAVTVLAGIALIATYLRGAIRAEPRLGRDLAVWIALVAVAMLVNAFFGGGVSEPQYRYQGRLVWLIPFLGVTTWALARGLGRRDARG